ncbi:MAG: radical SAM protein [Candidatus Altiarchaeota archaeon]
MKSLINHLRFVRKYPKVIPRLMWGTALGHLGIDRIRNTQLALSFGCNHTCKMCSSNLFLKSEKEFTLEEWCKTADELHDLGCVHYDLTGGEPTLKGLDYLCKLVGHINRRRDCIVDIATNGSKIEASWFKKLREAGLDSIFFDLQSDNPDEHDEIVGDPGNFKRIMDLIPQAKASGLNVCINTCLSKDNFEKVKGLLRMCEKGDMVLLINLAAPTGRLAGKDVRLMAFKDDYYRLLKSSSNIRSDTTFNYRGANLCPGGIEKVYITAYGDVMQCTFCQVAFGNLRQKPLKAIYDIMRKNPFIRERSICKHSFNDRFRDEWIEKYMDVNNPPTRLYESGLEA